MKFLIVTSAVHTYKDGQYFSFGPYVREMNIWIKSITEVIIVAPLSNVNPNIIDIPYNHANIKFITVPSINIQSLKEIIKTFFLLPFIIYRVFSGMKKADHIHLRCPGNMGLIGLFCQFFFPRKPKTVKYAGNWDNYPNEQFTYKLQKRIAKNPFLSRNTKVLIYGIWNDFTSNCYPFFTASYSLKDTQQEVKFKTTTDRTIKLIFAGTIDERKRPDYAIDTVYLLRENGYNIQLDIFGEGPYKEMCIEKIKRYNLENYVKIHGNISPKEIKFYFNEAHFLIFLSRMEGWPKVVAEAMFWGCVPITTKISCVPWMLDYGNRGVLVERNAESATKALKALIDDSNRYKQIQNCAIKWSRQYTLESFESEIQKFLL